MWQIGHLSEPFSCILSSYRKKENLNRLESLTAVQRFHFRWGSEELVVRADLGSRVQSTSLLIPSGTITGTAGPHNKLGGENSTTGSLSLARGIFSLGRTPSL